MDAGFDGQGQGPGAWPDRLDRAIEAPDLMQVLIVKTSSMGDVVHALPAVSDLVRHKPGVVIDWMVEAPFAAIPSMHPGVARVHVLRWRHWRKHLGDRTTWSALRAFRSQLRGQSYDVVIDLQGLLKSALWGRQARGPLVGYDSASLREPLAAWFYQRHAEVSRSLNAVTRCRQLVASHMGYAEPTTPPDFGLRPVVDDGWACPSPYVVLIPGASRPEKFWPAERWQRVGQTLWSQGCTPVVLWGSPAEERMAQALAASCHGVVPPFLTVAQAAGVLFRAHAVVGLDTGFSHLAAALGRPTLGIYCDHEPGLAGLTGSSWVRSVGGKGQVPSLEGVLALLSEQMAAAC